MNRDLSKFEPPKAKPDGLTKELFGCKCPSNVSKQVMPMKEALTICEEALKKHKGGKGAFLRICEIVEEYFEDKEDEDE